MDVNIGLLGFGTVGSGVYEALMKNKTYYKTQGININIKKILVKNIEKKRGNVDKTIFTNNIDDVFSSLKNSNGINILVEVMGNNTKEIILKAFKNNINVISANKDIISENLDEFLKTSKINNCEFKFEAAVGGGIPIIRTICNHFKGEKINKIQGILNGSTNYILSKLDEILSKQGSLDTRDVDKILEDAKELGYLEQDPTNDLKGFDSSRKIAILSSLAFKKNIKFKDVYTLGIDALKAEDIVLANKLGYKIKLVSFGEIEQNGIKIFTSPMLVSKNNILSNVNSNYNIVTLDSEFLGESFYIGKGAGKFETTSSVISDIFEIIEGNKIKAFELKEDFKILGKENINSYFYIRVKKEYKEIFNSFKKLEVFEDVRKNELGFILDKVNEKDFFEKINDIKVENVIRVLK